MPSSQQFRQTPKSPRATIIMLPRVHSVQVIAGTVKTECLMINTTNHLEKANTVQFVFIIRQEALQLNAQS
jgi:hypothetical protein